MHHKLNLLFTWAKLTQAIKIILVIALVVVANMSPLGGVVACIVLINSPIQKQLSAHFIALKGGLRPDATRGEAESYIDTTLNCCTLYLISMVYFIACFGWSLLFLNLIEVGDYNGIVALIAISYAIATIGISIHVLPNISNAIKSIKIWTRNN